MDKQGRRRDYSSVYLRRTYREAGKVKNETVADLSALPGYVIDLIDAGLKGQQLVPADEAVTITDTALDVTRWRDQIDAEAALDGSTCCPPPSRPARSARPAW